ncbi:MAG: triose-phosphate isomerase [Bacteroidetes bacterium]|nr:triose-phosphate isomerase [Bacteroidota bacterium]
MPKTIIAGNWKMNKNLAESVQLASEVVKVSGKASAGVELVVCPVFTHLEAVKEVIKGSAVKLGAQNCYPADSGAFTGEVSGSMLKAIGVEYVILGHSERRQYFHESNEFINKKVHHVLAHGMKPIYCVGELLEEREKGVTHQVVTEQINAGLANVTADQMKNVVIAYEPVWAIGTGKVASPEQANEVHILIRNLLVKLVGDAGKEVTIQYGGSMKPDNAKELLAQSEINGGLIGGAALKADDFLAIGSAK